MQGVNYRTYQMLKGDVVVEEIQCATFDRAIDYFFESHPHAYGDSSYQFKYVRKNYER